MSCFLIAPLFAGLEARGVSPEVIFAGLPFPVSHLRNTSRWVDWATLCELTDRMGEHVSEADLYEMGTQSFDTPVYKYVGAALGTFLRLEKAYGFSFGPKGLFHRYYTCFTSEVREVGPGRLELDLRMKPGYAVNPAFQLAVFAQLAAMPKVMGLPRATVARTTLVDGDTFHIQLPVRENLRHKARRLLSIPAARLSAAVELREAHGALQVRLRDLEVEVRRREEVERELRFEIEERERTEAAKAKIEKELQHARRLESIGLLAGGVAHDFNNLLMVIMGHASLALTETAEQEVTSSLQVILDVGERAAGLTRQLLAFGRRQVLKPTPLDIRRVVLDAQSLLRRMLPESIDLKMHTQAVVDPVVADPTQIEQVLTNLCINASDAMPSGGEISIELEPCVIDEAYAKTHSWARTGSFVRLRVSDSGSGIPADMVDKVFDPFFTTKAEGAGTGLGLSVVFGIVTQHDGFIHVYSDVGVGTCITIYLPTTALKSGPVAPSTDGPVPTGNETVLVVEDEPQVRALAQRVLEGAGYTVLTADSGTSGIACFKAHHVQVDLLLLDVILPGCSGKDVHDAAIAIRPDVRVLYTSGYSPRGIHTAFVLADGLELLPKPYSPETLLRRLRATLDK